MLLKSSMLCTTKMAGISYRKSGVEWGSFFHKIFVNWTYENIPGLGEQPPIMFDGEIEIDQSMFGKKQKYHKGARKGMQVHDLFRRKR